MRRILALFLPYLSTDRARRDAGSAEDNAPLVLTRRVGAAVRVEQRCPAAAQHGLPTGLTLGQARAMLPGLHAVEHQPQRDLALLHRLAGWALRFSPVVQPLPFDTLLLEVTGCARLFGGEDELVRQAVGRLLARGLHARGAIADTVGTAYALATCGGATAQVVPAGQSSAYLTPLPVAALRADPLVVAQLFDLGVRSIGDLLMLPRATLPGRFGATLVLRLQQALGETFEPITPFTPPQMASARIAFESALHEPAAVQAVAERLLAQVFAQVLSADAGLRELEVVLYWARDAAGPSGVDGAAQRMCSFRLRLARTARAIAHVAALLRERLERLDLCVGVQGLVLLARQTARWHPAQGELFEPRAPGEEERLGELIDRVAARLGERAIVQAQTADDHQPEQAYRYVWVAEVGLAAQSPSSTPPARGSARAAPAQADEPGRNGPSPAAERALPAAHPPRPLRVFARPVPVRVLAVVPDGPPTWLAYGGREFVLVAAWGPERIETGWWRGPDVQRDYFRVACAGGEQFWLFYERQSREWFVHGVFA